MTERNMVEALHAVLQQEMQRDSSVIILGEDVGVDGGVFRVTDKLITEFPGRVLDTPLAEAGIVGTSIGMAIKGMRPIAEIQFSGFSYLSLNQLINHASRIRNRTRGKLSCPLVVRTPYGGGIRALEHHSESMEAIYAHVPGLKVVIPSSPYQAKGLLASAIRDPDPVIFLEPKRVYRAIREEVPDEEYAIPIGKAFVKQEGNDITVIAWGAMLHEVQEAIQDLNYSIELIDLSTISPLDTDTIIASVKKTGRCVIVQEAPQSFSVASEIMARINEHAILTLHAPVARVTGYDVIMPLYKNELNYLPSKDRIQKKISETMNF